MLKLEGLLFGMSLDSNHEGERDERPGFGSLGLVHRHGETWRQRTLRMPGSHFELTILKWVLLREILFLRFVSKAEFEKMMDALFGWAAPNNFVLITYNFFFKSKTMTCLKFLPSVGQTESLIFIGGGFYCPSNEIAQSFTTAILGEHLLNVFCSSLYLFLCLCLCIFLYTHLYLEPFIGHSIVR